MKQSLRTIIQSVIIVALFAVGMGFAIAAPGDNPNVGLYPPIHQSVSAQYKAGPLRLGADLPVWPGATLDVVGQMTDYGAVGVALDGVIIGTAPGVNGNDERGLTVGAVTPADHALDVAGRMMVSELSNPTIMYVCADNNGVLFTSDYCNQLHESDPPPPPPSGSDACPNISGIQDSVPPGLIVDSAGNCVSPPSSGNDVCPNIPGSQPSLPPGLVFDTNGDCVEPSIDRCPDDTVLKTKCIPDENAVPWTCDTVANPGCLVTPACETITDEATCIASEGMVSAAKGSVDIQKCSWIEECVPPGEECVPGRIGCPIEPPSCPVDEVLVQECVVNEDSPIGFCDPSQDTCTPTSFTCADILRESTCNSARQAIANQSGGTVEQDCIWQSECQLPEPECPDGYTYNPGTALCETVVTVPIEEKLLCEFDMTFVIDRSGSVDDTEAGHVFTFLDTLLGTYLREPIENGSTAVSLIGFTGTAGIKTPLVTGIGATDTILNDAADWNRAGGGGTNLNAGYCLADQQYDQPVGGNRPGYPRKVVLLTDGVDMAKSPCKPEFDFPGSGWSLGIQQYYDTRDEIIANEMESLVIGINPAEVRPNYLTATETIERWNELHTIDVNGGNAFWTEDFEGLTDEQFIEDIFLSACTTEQVCPEGYTDNGDATCSTIETVEPVVSGPGKPSSVPQPGARIIDNVQDLGITSSGTTSFGSGFMQFINNLFSR